MKKLNDELKSVSKNLNSLAKQVDRITKQVAKLQTAKTTTKAKTKAKPAAKKKAAAPKKKAARPAAAKGATVLDSVYNVIKGSKKGVNIATLRQKTALDARQLSNALYKLSKKGQIKSVSRGVYTKA